MDGIRLQHDILHNRTIVCSKEHGWTLESSRYVCCEEAISRSGSGIADEDNGRLVTKNVNETLTTSFLVSRTSKTLIKFVVFFVCIETID